jgi:serine O-acetyltransferase
MAKADGSASQIAMTNPPDPAVERILTVASESPPRIAFPAELYRVIDGLEQARLDWRTAHPRNTEQGRRFPARQALDRIVRELSVALFPLRFGPPELDAGNENAYIAATLEATLSQLGAQIGLELSYHAQALDPDDTARRTDAIIGAFAAALPAVRRLLDSDVEAAYDADPAARSVDEVLLTYPSITAVIHYRLAHRLHALGAPLVARIITEIAHSRTGIDIHPAAKIGRNFFIDHGTGVVIGETTIIGARVRLYQGVTLGGDPDLAHAETARGAPRHPIIEDDVTILAGTSIFGRVTIEARSRVGSNLRLSRDIPADSLVEPAEPNVRAISYAVPAGADKQATPPDDRSGSS